MKVLSFTESHTTTYKIKNHSHFQETSLKAFPLLRRTFAVLALTTLGAVGAHAADDWPKAKPITLVVPFAPGGTSDILGRLIAQELGASLSQTVLVENKGGAGGVPVSYTHLTLPTIYSV